MGMHRGAPAILHSSSETTACLTLEPGWKSLFTGPIDAKTASGLMTSKRMADHHFGLTEMCIQQKNTDLLVLLGYTDSPTWLHAMKRRPDRYKTMMVAATGLFRANDEPHNAAVGHHKLGELYEETGSLDVAIGEYREAVLMLLLFGGMPKEALEGWPQVGLRCFDFSRPSRSRRCSTQVRISHTLHDTRRSDRQ